MVVFFCLYLFRLEFFLLPFSGQKFLFDSCQINSSKIIPHSHFFCWYIYQFEFNDLHDMVFKVFNYLSFERIRYFPFIYPDATVCCLRKGNIEKGTPPLYLVSCRFSVLITKRERMQFNGYKTCNVMYRNHETIILNLTVNFMKFKCAIISHCICWGTWLCGLYGKERQT